MAAGTQQHFNSSGFLLLVGSHYGAGTNGKEHSVLSGWCPVSVEPLGEEKIAAKCLRFLLEGS